MTFRIRPLHERAFSLPTQSTKETSETTELVEDTVFVVDEETGEIKEEKQMVEKTVAGKDVVPELPRKQSAKIFSLSMKKRNKVSFM